MDADKYTEWLRHNSLRSIIIIIFVEPLNPWKPGAQMPKNITEWEPKQTRIMDAAYMDDYWPYIYQSKSINIYQSKEFNKWFYIYQSMEYKLKCIVQRCHLGYILLLATLMQLFSI